jgi:hypothetical protein
MRSLVSKGELVGDFRTPSDYVNARALAANTEESTTVPTGASLVRIKCTADFYCVVGATATVPGDTTDGSACELNPTGYVVYPGQVIHVISAANAVITFSYYK